MANNALTEDDDEIVIIETEDEQIPTGQPDPEVSEEPEDDEDEEEERLAMSEDDSDEEITAKHKDNRERRQKRREVQKRAKENAKRELDFLRQQNAELARRVQNIEGNSLSQQVTSIEQQLQKTLYEAQQAEQIMARAIEAGNGDDAAAALRIRDDARTRANELNTYKQQAEQYAQQARQPQVDPRVIDYAKQWLEANPWYNPQGRDEDSAVTKAIDNSLAAEGWNPADEGYWQELTRRVSARIGGDDSAPRQQAAPKRKAPPTGNTREHAPSTSRNEVYVTPARKQAMIDAGIWDDPVRRDAQVRAYREYDRNNSAR